MSSDTRKVVDETGKLLHPKRLKQPFCMFEGHEVDESTVYRSGFGCVVNIYLRCSRCGKRFHVEPDFSNFNSLELF